MNIVIRSSLFQNILYLLKLLICLFFVVFCLFVLFCFVWFFVVFCGGVSLKQYVTKNIRR